MGQKQSGSPIIEGTTRPDSDEERLPDGTSPLCYGRYFISCEGPKPASRDKTSRGIYCQSPEFPNGAAIESIATGVLSLAQPKISQIPAHIFKNDTLDRSLIFISDYRNNGCTAMLTAREGHHDKSR